MEKFKLVEGNSNYEVSDLGTVRNATTKHIIKQRVGSSPYLIVKLNGKSKLVHRLVALAFIPNPENKLTVNHKHGIKSDNRASELEWATQSENNQHMYDTGLKKYRPLHYKGKFGAEHNRSKAIMQKKADGSLIAEFGSISEASRSTKLGVSTIAWACLKGCINRKTQTYFTCLDTSQ